MKKQTLLNRRLRLLLPVLSLWMAGMLTACSASSIPGFSSSGAASSTQAQAQQTQVQPQASSPDNASVDNTSTALATDEASTNAVAPTLAVDPPGGYGGIYIRVMGENWPRNMTVLVALADETGKSNTLATADTDFEGTLATGFLYPIDERWLQNNVYQVIATTADGRHEAVAAFNVGEPGTAVATAPETPAEEPAVDSPEPVALAEQEAVEADTVEAETVEAETNAAQEGDSPEAEDEIQDDEAQDDEAQEESADAQGEDEAAQVAEAAQDTPVAFAADDIIAGFVPVDVRRNRGKFTIQARAEGHREAGYQLVASIRTPPLEDYSKIELDRDDDWEVEFGRNKVEIEAPNPDELLGFMEMYGGFPVEDGQLVEIRLRRNHKVELEQDDGVLEIKAAEVVLQVLLIGPDGQSEMVVVTLDSFDTPPGLERGRGPTVEGPPAWAERPSGRPGWSRNRGNR